MSTPKQWTIIPILKESQGEHRLPLGPEKMGWLVINSHQENYLIQGSGKHIATVHVGDEVVFAGSLTSKGRFLYSSRDHLLSHSDMTLIKDHGTLHFMTQYTANKPTPVSKIGTFEVSLEWELDQPDVNTKGVIKGTLNVIVGEPP